MCRNTEWLAIKMYKQAFEEAIADEEFSAKK